MCDRVVRSNGGDVSAVPAYSLVLLRHGESIWNRENRFSGWTDVDLSTRGVDEAHEAGRVLREGRYTFDIAYTSVLKRAIRTLWIVLDELNLMWIPVSRSWRLNERHYGALQGLNKAQTASEMGGELVESWRRSFAVRPPALSREDRRYPGNDPRYRSVCQVDLPQTESLSDTVARFLPFWQETIASDVRAGKRVLIVAHGNSLRALVKYLDGIPDNEITKLNIPTGIPLVYELNMDLSPVSRQYLGDPEAVRAAEEKVAHQARPSRD